MTDNDLREIEETLGVTLPVDYRSVMTSGHARESGDPFHGALYNDSKYVLRDTLRLRKITKSYDDPCPRSWVVVCQIDGGDYAFIDTAETNGPMRVWNHETMQVEPWTDTITQFAESIVELFRSKESK